MSWPDLIMTECALIIMMIAGWKLGRRFEAATRDDPSCPFKPYTDPPKKGVVV